jgi:hypothetical protein
MRAFEPPTAALAAFAGAFFAGFATLFAPFLTAFFANFAGFFAIRLSPKQIGMYYRVIGPAVTYKAWRCRSHYFRPIFSGFKPW